MPKFTILVMLILTALVCFGCGPIKSTLTMKDVEHNLKQAEKNEAGDKVASAYYYWAAREYLTKAKRTHGYSDFDASDDFAKKALELAQKAVEKSEGKGEKVVEPELNKFKKKKGKKSKKKSSD